MKKMLTMLLVAVCVVSFAGCAGMSKGEKTRIKCPACGYEFEAPIGG